MPDFFIFTFISVPCYNAVSDIKEVQHMRRFVSLLFVFLALTLPALAHPGRTDSKGGHKNSSTGEYHYHHGEPAHQHVNGFCPYATVTPTPKATPRATPRATPKTSLSTFPPSSYNKPKTTNKNSGKGAAALAGAGGTAVAFAGYSALKRIWRS